MESWVVIILCAVYTVAAIVVAIRRKDKVNKNSTESDCNCIDEKKTGEELMSEALHELYPVEDLDPNDLYGVPEDERVDFDVIDEQHIAGEADFSEVNPDEGEFWDGEA